MTAHAYACLLLCGTVWAAAAHAQTETTRTSFRVKYVIEDAVYLDGGRDAGLTKGMKLTVKRPVPGSQEGFRMIAEVEVSALGSTSAVCDIRSAKAAIRVGDIAYLSPEEIKATQQEQGTLIVRKYPQVVSFTEGDPLDEEQREAVPHPPSPEINRLRGRIGVDYNTIQNVGASGGSSVETGLVLQANMTRIGGTYWNFNGYWRGRMSSQNPGAQQQTLTDLINRTYTLALTYNNPNSRWVAGFGRLFLPWATSFGVIDGGYLGRRAGSHVTYGLFGGSTPDPTAWNYNPNRQMAGSFVNFDTGSFESLRFTSTAGLALTRINWKPDRQFAFFENGLFYRRYLSIYHALEADLIHGNSTSTTSTGGTNSAGNGKNVSISSSFLTFRLQPHRRVSFDVNHTYFRDTPTFDPRLVGTGLLDKYLFQGLSGGVRVDLPERVSVYTNIGRSTRTGDARGSWNQLYGITLGQIWRTGVRVDARYSKFSGSFGSGSYDSLSFSRQLSERFRMEVQVGKQSFASTLTRDTGANFLNLTADWFPGRHYFLGAGSTLYRGNIQAYNQWFLSTGYRF
jgi:hypothetical protein